MLWNRLDEADFIFSSITHGVLYKKGGPNSFIIVFK